MAQGEDTYTRITTIDGETEVKTESIDLSDTLPSIIFCEIEEDPGSINTTSFINEELVIAIKDDTERIRPIINDVDLLLYVQSGDGENYSINDNGDLIYTKEV
jgi:hypothetical protein